MVDSRQSTVDSEQPIPLVIKAGLVVEVLRAYVCARISVKRYGLPQTLDRLRDTTIDCRLSTVDPKRLGRVVTRTLAPLPADTRCLMRSLVLTRVLARRGIATRLVIGVHPGERFAAHAWVEHDGAALLPTGGSDFDELVTL